MSDRKAEIHRKVATLGSLPDAERLRLIAEGLPILLASAQEVVRCPPKRQKYRNRTLSNFYDHLSRLIFAAASGWNPATVAELTRYVNHEGLVTISMGSTARNFFSGTVFWMSARPSFTRIW